MTETERTALKEKILRAMEETQARIAQLEDATQPVAPENSIGRVSRMDAINNKSVAEATLRTARKKLSNLEVALKKVHDKNFGYCSRCKQPIQTARLMFMPQSTRCIRCADKA
jgi:DnaK suppressor protein